MGLALKKLKYKGAKGKSYINMQNKISDFIAFSSDFCPFKTMLIKMSEDCSTPFFVFPYISNGPIIIILPLLFQRHETLSSWCLNSSWYFCIIVEILFLMPEDHWDRHTLNQMFRSSPPNCSWFLVKNLNER